MLASPTMDRSSRTVLRRFGRVVRAPPLETGSERLIVVGDYLRAGLPRVWRTLRSALADPLEESLPLVRVPALVVRGSRDPIVSRRWAQDVARLLPEGRYAEIPGAPHAANYSTPHALVRLVLPFLEGVRP